MMRVVSVHSEWAALGRTKELWTDCRIECGWRRSRLFYLP